MTWCHDQACFRMHCKAVQECYWDRACSVHTARCIAILHYFHPPCGHTRLALYMMEIYAVHSDLFCGNVASGVRSSSVIAASQQEPVARAAHAHSTHGFVMCCWGPLLSVVRHMGCWRPKGLMLQIHRFIILICLTECQPCMG